METITEIFTWATGLIDSLSQLVTDSPLTYLLILGLVAFDVVIPILPSESIVTAAAVLAGQGQLSIVWVMIAAGLGAFVGDNVAYWIGRAAGRPLIERVLRGRTDKLEDVERQFQRRGGTFIIVGRFIPGGRTVVAIGAGVLHFNWLKFIAYDIVAVVIWALLAAVPGYIGGVIIQDKPWLALVIGFGLSMLVAGGMLLFQRWREGKRDESDVTSSADVEPASVVPGEVPGTDGPG
ncbi:MAG: DedA family protein [Chloroflexota bacterium]